jgi:hypothetical protein
MLFRRPVLDAIADGSVTLAFRRWKQPRVRPGSRLRTPIGVVEVDAVDVVDPSAISDRDARRAGHPSRAELLADLDAPPKRGIRGRPPAPRDGSEPIYRVTLHLTGPDPRVALRERVPRDATELAELRNRLTAIDARSARGPWTEQMLRLIAANPGTRAPDLAAGLGRPVPRFKADVRRLKELGLTESLPVGYRLSPRGEALLATLDAPLAESPPAPLDKPAPPDKPVKRRRAGQTR